jgi:hypothetical protein
VLDGCFFTGTTNVSLNAVAAAFNVINDNELEITLPALATPGDYTISVTNAAGTGFSADLITVHPEFTSTASTDNDVSCFGGSDGNATATEIGGTAPFEYIWSDGQTTSTASGLTEGIYTVTLSDDNNCTFENTVTITEPTAITVTPSITSNYNGEDISCFGSSDGEATVLATGGTGTDYSYLWSDADNQTTTVATGLIAGTFFISVEDENNCLQVESITVTQPDELNPNIVLSDFNGFQISCFGQTDGEIQLTPSGGVAPYTFLWNADANNETTATVTGLAEGLNYTVTITDDNGCENISTITITEPLLLTSTITDFINACSGSTTGEATVTVVGGATPYSFLWDDTANQTSPTATGLDANEYQVTVTDANGCESTASVTITDQAALTANATTDNDASCGGYADGEGTITPVGGGTSFSYFWPISADNQTTATATGLTAGTYTITVIDNNNCFAEASITVTEPDPVVPTLTITSSYNGSEISCLGASDGIATTNPIGGTGTYTSYFWSANAQTTASASGLAAGVYNITVTDSDNCEGYESITVTSPSSIDVNINITSNYNGEDISCFGGNDGTANAIPSGGTGAYSYLWSFAGQTSATATGLNAGIHSVTVYDANSCESVESITLTQPSNVTTTTTVSSNYNGQNISCNGENDGEATTTPSGGTGAFSYLWSAGAQTTQTATGLSVGVFTVTIEDDNGCLTSSSITLTQPSNITTTASVSSNYNGEDISCNGESDGQATATPSGGTGAFSYLWSASAQTTQTATGLSAGTYTVTATDLNGCSSTASTTITEPTIVDVSAAVTSNYNGTQISCNGASDGVITATPSGGVTPYTYLWNDAANQVTNSATGLPVGTFNVTIFDANGCSANDNATLSQPTAVTVSAVITSNYNGAQISCNGLSNGTASATPSNGTPSYTYLWSVNAQTTATATGLNAGVHTVTVFDSNNCSATASITATQPTAVTVTSSVTSSYGGGVETTCSYSSDGEVLAAGSGGTGAFSYVWNDAAAQTTAAATGLPSGTYQVTATDANGCQNTSSVSITPAPVIVTNPSQTNVTLFGGQDGEAAVSPTGGVGAFTFLWDNEITNSLVPPDFTGSTITGLKADVFNVTITDNNGCNAFESITITQADSLQGGEITIIGAVDGIYNVCKNNNTAPDYLNSIAPYGGTPPFTYTWQYSTNFTSWTNYPASNSIDFSSGATITQTTVVRRRVLDAAGATAYSSYLLLYLADTTTTVSLLEPTYCLNDSSEHTLSVIPSNATSTWTLRDLDVVSPAPDELLATNPNGTAFFIPSSVSDSGNYVMIHTYENDNGCTSTLSIPVFMHTFTDATFNLDPIYNSNITSVPLNEITIVNPTGGEFAGPGVSSFDKVFSPSIAGAGIHVLTYTYTDPNSGCVDVTKDSTQVIIAEGNFVGLPAGNWFCVNSVRDTLRADVGVNGIVGSATFSITPIVPYPNIPQLIDTDNAGVDSVIIRPNFAPAGGGEYILSFTYISNQDSVTELSVSEFIKFADFSNIDLIASASANLRYCEADPIDTITAIFSYPNGGNVGAGTYSGSLLISDIVSLPGSAEIDPNMPASNIINYTYTDPISGCVANINRNLFVNALPILEITSLNPNNSYCIDESPQTLNTNILGGNFTTGSGVSAGTSFIQSVCIFDSPGGNGNCSFTNDLCNDGYQYIFAGNNINSDPFTIGSEKLINDITLSIYYTNCSGISSSFQVFLNGNLISTNPVLDFSCSCIPSNGYPQTFVIPGNSINPFWNFGGNNIITVRNANVDIYYAGISANVSYTGGFVFNPSVATAGNHTITYTYSDENGCTSQVDSSVVVHELPVVNFTIKSLYNIEEATDTLYGTPWGGTFSGNSIVDTVFYPPTAGIGIHPITYNYTETVTGCSNFITIQTEVQEASGYFDGLIPIYCTAGSEDTLWTVVSNSNGNPGIYSITGNNGLNDLLNDSAEFVPSLVTAGFYTISYTYLGFDDFTTFTIDTLIEVIDLGSANILGLEDGYCVDAEIDSLFGIPNSFGNGQFTSVLGLNVALGDTALFNPSVAGVGLHNIHFVFTDVVSGCIIDTTMVTEVYDLPTPSFTLNPIYNIVGSNQTLVGTPSGGTFSGDGMTGDTFSPADAGLGIASVTYTYTDANACTNFVTEITDVQEAAGTFFGIPANNYFCIDGDDTEIWAIPDNGDGSIGTYTGTAITDLANDTALFASNTLTIGSYIITYTYKGIDGVTSFQIDTTVYVSGITSIEINEPNTMFCINDDPFDFSGSPAGGTFSSPNAGLSGSTFTPSIAGLGLKTITYLYTDPVSLCSREISRDLTVNGLPDIGIASNFANSYCLNADTIQVQGLINLAPAGIGTFYGNAIVESLNNGTGKYVAGDVGVPLENIVDTIWFNYIDPSTGCENTVFRSTVVRSLPEPRIQGLNEEKMYCQNFGTVFLGGSDSLGNPGSGSWVINNNPATSQFNTNTLPDTLVSIAFTWSITGFGCSNTFFDTIRIASVPVASFVVGNNCMTHPTEFFSTSTVNNVLGDYIESWFWNFGDLSFGNSNDTSSLENPIYQYSVPAEYTINLEVTTNNGCVGVVPAIDRRVRFGTSPPVNYTWLNECYPGENTVFSSDDETNNFPGVKTYIWKFGDGNSISADNLIETNHHYQDTGSYVTQLIIDTDNGCIDSISKIINIRSVYTPSRFSAYKTDFESGKDGWLSENKENSLNSWAFGTPNKEIINSANSGIKTWITNLDTNYYDNEKSWISSPCFNLSELQRPMIKLWINSSMPNNDGLVLQYSVDAGISWKNVGTTNSGINWYNTSGIEGNPGEQTVLSGFSGWSGTTEGWIECRNNLDSLIGQNNVRFRLAFGSNGIQNGEGIAFDDIWIGERSRVALIENFTNSNSTQAVDAENLINKIADENPLDVLAIQYHTSFPGVDEFNQTNPADPSARGLYYGVNSVPYAALDGNQFNGSNLTKKEIDMRVLQDPQFDIYLSSEFTSSNTIDINSTITCKSAIGQTEVSLQLAIIEKIVGTNKYVLREMIPDASGFVFKQSWQPGYQQSVNVSHTIKNIENIDNFRLIAFVQDNNSKEVYQATYNDSALFSTSLKEIEFSDILDFNMYPNPTNQFVNIQLIGNDNVHSSIQIYDQLGKLAYQTTVDKYDTFIQIELNALQNGLYFVQLKNEKNQSSIKKLMIVK